MALSLPLPLPASWAGRPPHMSSEDLSVWSRWAPSERPRWRALYFDVGLGPGRDAGAGVALEHAVMWQRITQKRADVVADAGDHWELVELRHNAQANALGRLLQYQALWAADPPDSRPLLLYLVTDLVDVDLAPLLMQHGVKYVVV